METAAANLFKELTSIATVKAAAFANQDATQVQVEYSVRDIDNDAHRRYMTVHHVHPAQQQQEQAAAFPLELRDLASRTFISPSKQYMVMLRTVTPKPGQNNGKPLFTWDIWSVKKTWIASIDTSSVHGKVYAEGGLGGITWSKDESFFIYVAEPKVDNGVSFFTTDEANANKKKGSQFEYVDDWGEQMVGTVSPRLYLCSIKQKKTVPVVGTPDSVTCGNVVICPDQESVVFRGLPHFHRRLGFVFYNSRPSNLYYLSLKSTLNSFTKKDESSKSAESLLNGDVGSKSEDVKKSEQDETIQITFSDHSARCPRFSPDGSRLVFLTTDNFYFHRSCDRLRYLDWSEVTSAISTSFDSPSSASVKKLSVESKSLIDTVYQPANSAAFPGLWADPFGGGMISQPFVAASWLLITSTWRSRDVLLLIDISTGSVHRIDLAGEHPLSSVSLLDVSESNSRALISVSTVNQVEKVLMLNFDLSIFQKGQLPSELKFRPKGQFLNENRIYFGDFVAVTSPSLEALSDDTRSRLSHIKFEIVPIQALISSSSSSSSSSSNATSISDLISQHPQLSSWNLLKHERWTHSSFNLNPDVHSAENFEAIVVSPPSDVTHVWASSEKPKSPVILFPHGGPHGTFTSAFVLSVAYFAICGFTIILVNYRGSTAFGQTMLTSLPGNCGANDVDDCIGSLLQVCTHDMWKDKVDPQRVCVYGGSHGGFLAGHLIGQFPSIFSSSVMRNPVLNIAWEVGSTDIPDWCYVETGLPYPDACEQAIPTADEYHHMFKMSPIVHISQVKSPTMLQIGTGDRRVPVHQSIEYYKILKSRGIPVKLLSYPDATHGLADKPSIECDGVVNAAAWMLTHTFLLQ